MIPNQPTRTTLGRGKRKASLADSSTVSIYLDTALIRHHMQRALIGPLIFVLSIGLSFLHPYLAEVSWLFIGVAIYLHERWYRQRSTRSHKGKATS